MDNVKGYRRRDAKAFLHLVHRQPSLHIKCDEALLNAIAFEFFTSMKSFQWMVVWLVLLSCANEQEREARLAKIHCASCHMFPEPALLGKETWDKGIFPQMAFRMGVDLTNLITISPEDMPIVTASLPRKAMVTKEEFEAIRRYFMREAPDSLALPASFGTSELTQFEVSAIRFDGNRLPAISMIVADTVRRAIWISNRRSDLLSYSFDWKQGDSIRLDSPASWMSFKNGQSMVSAMGIMDPNDQPRGDLVLLQNNVPQVVVDSLKRPVHFEQADFNLDGREDLVVCDFGNYTGELVVFENTASGNVRHTLSYLPGARRVIVKDFNGDKRPDILALFEQGDENISLFTNAGNFTFRVERLLRFPPVMGSSYLDIADFNNDGAWDILYTNGDDADYSVVLKPYHGVHIYLNDGRNKFTESWFHPMPGCSKAVADDFDSDGDLDVAAISFFPDFDRTPERGFIYFRRDGEKYVPCTTQMGSSGRWLVMEMVDIDGDEDNDLLLGALNFGGNIPTELLHQWMEKPVDILVLKNNQTK
jgi:hypothetical protein